MPRFVLVVIAVLLGVAVSPAWSATYRHRVAQVPTEPKEGETVRIWMESDTAFGETAGVELHVVGTGTYVKVLGAFDDVSGPPPANWWADLPPYPAGTTIEYQLFTRNESGADYGFTGFNWSYTVAPAHSPDAAAPPPADAAAPPPADAAAPPPADAAAPPEADAGAPDASEADAAAAPDARADAKQDLGCGCRVSARRPSANLPLAALPLVLIGLRRRGTRGSLHRAR